MPTYVWSTYRTKKFDGRNVRIWEIFDTDSCSPQPHDQARIPKKLKRFIKRYNKERTITNADVHVLDIVEPRVRGSSALARIGPSPKDRIARGKRLPTKCYYGKM